MNNYSAIVRVKVEGYQDYKIVVSADSFEEAKTAIRELNQSPRAIESQCELKHTEVWVFPQYQGELLHMEEEK